MLLVIFLTVLSTFLGGLFALYNQDKLHRILGFSAGVILGVVALDILPEVFEMAHSQEMMVVWPMVFFVAGFLTFHVIEKLLIIHVGHEEEYGHHHHPKLGVMSAIALVGHSLLDGIGIGLAFKVNPQIGLAVAIAVIAHDFADGLNTVSLMLSHQNDRKTTWWYLALDAIAPVIGLVFALVLPIPMEWLVLFLGFFGGSLLYICAGDILPEAHSKHPSSVTLALTVVGVVFIFIVTRLIAI